MQSPTTHATPRQFTRNRKPSSTTTTTPLRTLTRTPPSRSNRPPTPGFLVPTFTPIKPTLLDPESPFVVPSTIKNAQAVASSTHHLVSASVSALPTPGATKSTDGTGSAFFSPSYYSGAEPSSVHRGMRAKLFGQGVEGGYLVSPLGITPWKRSTGKMGAGGMGMGMGTPNGRGGDLTGVDPFVVHPGEEETFVPRWESMRGVPGEDEEQGTGTNMGGFQDGFDYIPHSHSHSHSHSQSGQGESIPSEGFGSHHGTRYPSGLGLGAGFVPSTSLGSRVPPGTITQRTVSYRRNHPQSTANVHAQEEDLDPSGSSSLPTPRSNGPLLSLHPASSPFPTMEPASTPSQERSNPSVIHVGPAGRRMHQQGLSSSIPPAHPISTRSASSSHLNTVAGARLGGSILMSRSVSTSAIGLHPTSSSSLSASSTTTTTTSTSTTSSSAFTSRPLARMGFSRNVSNCSVETAGTVSSINTNTSNAEIPISPHLYADSTPGTGTESPAFSSTTTGYGHFQPYFPLHLPPSSSRTNHHRHLSGTMSLSTTDGTPVLDSSLPSPAFTQGHSPLITPVVGGSNASGPPRSAGTYFSSSSTLSSTAATGSMGSEYSFQRKLGGLAIQVDGTDACWDQAPLSAMSVLSANTIASASASGQDTPCSLVTGHERMTVPTALGVMDPDGRSSISPADPSQGLLGNQLQVAQAAAFETYGLGAAQYAGMDGQGDYELAIPSEQQQQQQQSHSHSHWLPNDTSAYPSPMGLALPMNYYPVSAGTSNHGLRHVSSPYHAFPARSTLDDQPAQSHLPAPRSVSAGYIPMITPGFSQDSFLNMNDGTGSNDSLSYAHSNPPGSALPDHPHSAAYSVSFPTASGSSMGLMSAILDEGNDHASKRQRIKYPPVGKRLRPGPKPKPRTPKSKGRENLGAGALGRDPLPYDPFVEIARESVKESRSIMSDVMEERPVLSRPSSAVPAPIVTAPPSSTVTPAGSASPRNPPTALTTTALASEPQSAIPRSYLESCYIMFMIPDPENGGAPTKRYRCNIDDCQRVFPRKSAIHSHIQTHLEDKPFVCTEPECNAAFVRQHDLRRHIRIHSGTKPFPCPCGKGFARGDALMRHRQRGICVGSVVPLKPVKRKASDSN